MTKRRRTRGSGGIEEVPRADGSVAYKAVHCWTDPGTGKRRRSAKVFARRIDAERWAAAQTAAGKPTSVGTLGQWADDWLVLHKARVSPSAYKSDSIPLRKKIVPRLGRVRLRDLTALTCERFLAELTASKVSKSEVHRAGKVLRNVLNAAVRAGLLGAAPKFRVPGPGRPQTVSLTAEELGRLILAADAAGRGPMFRLWAELGLRPAELVGLRWEDYDPTTATVRVSRSIDQLTGEVREPKTPRVRALPLSPDTAARLEAVRDGATSGIMFPTTRGGYYWPAGFLKFVWRPIREAAGLPTAGRYVIRHTCATLLLRSGVSLRAVADRLGHADVTQTLKAYSHALPDDQHLAAGAWAKILGAVGR